MAGYAFFAEVYDELTQNVPYSAQAKYIKDLCNKFKHDFGLTLDLACGTGSLTLALAELDVDVFGVDNSCEMLSIAQQKAAQNSKQILFLCQDMRHLNLYSTIDTCICTLDSINHLTSIKDVEQTFARVHRFLSAEGLFIFDVNTLYKHRHVLQNNTFVYDTADVYCVWQNELNQDASTVEITLDFFVPQKKQGYLRYSEQFSEKAYTNKEIEHILKKVGFEVCASFEEQTFAEPTKETQRIVYVVRKKENLNFKENT